MIQDFKYFFQGGLGPRQVCFYGLYSPVLDGFLICSTDYHVMYQLQLILSSRYMLHIVELAHADNFEIQLLDNTCCENWSFQERNTLRLNWLSRALQWHTTKHLCPSTKPLDIDLLEEKKYVFTCAHWIEYFSLISTPPERFKSDLSDLIGYDNFNLDFTIIKQKAMRLLYLGLDFETTDSDIRKLINDQKKNHIS